MKWFDFSRGRPDVERDDLNLGYYVTYREVPNGKGGYHPVDLTLHHDSKGLHRKITGRFGQFCAFPGICHGGWEKNLTSRFWPVVNFVYEIGPFEHGLARFEWMVQPDGRYYADEDGFGMEDDDEIWLYSYLGTDGKFKGKFRAVDG